MNPLDEDELFQARSDYLAEEPLTDEQRANLTRWILELESGNRKQTTGKLREQESATDVSYCCLGVACDLQNPHLWIVEESEEDYELEWLVGGWNGFSNEELPYEDQWFLKTYALQDAGIETLAAMNDHGESFADIAQRLREWFGSPLAPEEVVFDR